MYSLFGKMAIVWTFSKTFFLRHTPKPGGGGREECVLLPPIVFVGGHDRKNPSNILAVIAICHMMACDVC